MNGHRLYLPALLALAPAAAGCGDASSAAVSTPRAESPRAPGAPPATAAIPVPGAVTPLTRDATGTIETTFDDVKFPMEKTDAFVESMLTPRVKSLFGERIRLRGYIYPTPRKKGLKQFVLVRDNMECCFGPGAALFDCVLVTMAGDATAEYSIRPVAVEGTFRLAPLPGPDGRPLAIYQMDAEAVK
jgi:hypothetical protein